MKKEKSGDGGVNWMDTYGDMVTLLLRFSVMLYSTSTLDREEWTALVQSFNPTEEVTKTQFPSVSGGEGIGTQEDISRDMEELYRVMWDYVQQAGMANQVALGEGNGYVFIPSNGTVFFDGDSYELRDEGKIVLDKVPQVISEISSSIDEICILGHTVRIVSDRMSNVTADHFLASSCATVVTIYLQEKDIIDPARLASVGCGEQRPMFSNDTSVGRAKNRRVELIATELDLDDEIEDNITQYYIMRESTGTPANP